MAKKEKEESASLELKEHEIKAKIIACINEFEAASEQNQLEWREKANDIYRLINADVTVVDENGKEERPVHLNRIQIAHERLAAEYGKGLVDFDKWIKVSKGKIGTSSLMTEFEANRLLMCMLDFSEPKVALVDSVRNALAENLICLKIEKYYKKMGDREILQFRWVPKSIEEMLLDPEPNSELYLMEVGIVEKSDLLSNPDFADEADDIKSLSRFDITNRYRKRESDGETPSTTPAGRRFPIKVIQFWGTILDDDGTILKWTNGKELKNVNIFVANNQILLCDPVWNKRFSSSPPYIVSKLLRTSRTKFGNAVLFNGMELNQYYDTLFQNLIDAGLKEGHNVTAVREHLVKNKEVLNGPLKYNTTLYVNEDAPSNAKVFETEKLGQVSQGMLAVTGQVNQMMGESMLANEQFFSGTPQASVSATGQLQSNNIINGLYESHASNVDDLVVENLALETFHDILRAKKEIPDDYLKWVFSDRPQNIQAFKAASKKDILNELGYAFRFQGKGRRGIAAAKAKAAAIVQLSSVIFGNQMLTQELLNSGFSIKSILAEVFKSVEIDPEEMQLSAMEEAILEKRLLVQEEVMGMLQMGPQQPQQPQQQGQMNPIQNMGSEFPVGQQNGQQQ